MPQRHETLAQKPYSPMTEIWRDYGAKIDSLTAQGTSIKAWRALPPESETAVSSESELHDILSKYESVSAERIEHYYQLFMKADKTIHFGLELDFRALVFFDEDGRTMEAFVMAN